MHDSSLLLMKKFEEDYASKIEQNTIGGIKVLDVGSLDVNGSFELQPPKEG